MTDYEQLAAWIAAHFDEQVLFLQALVRVPTDTPPGDNAPHAVHTAQLLTQMGLSPEIYPVPDDLVRAQGMRSISNLIVRHKFGEGKTIALNAHGDVVPPGDGWTHDPYGAAIQDGQMFGRATAVSKSDFATYTFALRALMSLGTPLAGSVELHFTYDEEFGGELGPGWLLRKQLTRPDLVIAAGFSYEVVTAHSGCLQMEVTVHGTMAHAAVPHTGVDALQATVRILQALYGCNEPLRQIRSEIAGIEHPYLNIGRIEGGTNTNVVPGKILFKLDRRMVPEEDAAVVEAELRKLIADTAAQYTGITVDIRRILLAQAMRPLPGNRDLVASLRKHAAQGFGQEIPEMGTPLYTDARLYASAGIPAVIYGAGPRTVLESHAKRADERLDLQDLRRATLVVARSLRDLLA